MTLATVAVSLRTPGVPLGQLLGNLIAKKPSAGRLRFTALGRHDEWAALGRMRARVYREALPYLLDELDGDGMDGYDETSFVFAAWWNGEVVGTIRATPHPYETLKYVDAADLRAFLGPGWKTDYLEWGRLVVDTGARVNRVAPALITYAGLWLLLHTRYRGYFGYMRQRTTRLLRPFHFSDEAVVFTIPKRGDHEYTLVKGRLGTDFLYAIPRWVAALFRARARRRTPTAETNAGRPAAAPRAG